MIPFHVLRLKHVSSCTQSHLFFLSLRAIQFCFSQKSPIPSANDIIILILNGRGNKRKKASDYKMVDLLVVGVGVGGEQQVVEDMRTLASLRTGIIDVSLFKFTSHANTQVV